MGWLFMSSLGRFSSPKAYLEDQFTYTGETKTSTVVASAMVGMRTWYAACRQVDKETGLAETFAIVCLIQHNPRATDGMVFGYKDMTEHMGPCEARCPASILDLLSPTQNDSALGWRERCREHHKRMNRPEPRSGDMIVFAASIEFSDGHRGNKFRFEKRGRQTIFTRVDAIGDYRIKNWKTVAWTIIPAIAIAQMPA